MIESKIVVAAGRVLIAALFVISGIGKILARAGAIGYMAWAFLPCCCGRPSRLKFGGGIAIALGLQVRFAAPALAIFSIIAAVIFHHKLSDPMQQLMFLTDFAVAGGLALAWAVDQRRAATQ